MWSDKATPDQLQHAIGVLRSVVPPPAGPMDGTIRELHSRATPEQVAMLLQSQPGFIWLDGNDSRHLFFINPIATLSSDNQGSNIRASERNEHLSISSMDLLDAAQRAWQTAHRAMLAGCISYDIVDELENIGHIPPLSPGFPRMHFGLYDSVLICYDGKWSVVHAGNWLSANAVIDSINVWEKVLIRAEAACSSESEELSGPPITVQSQSATRFLRSVETIVDRIHKGDFFQTNICRVFTAHIAPALSWPLYPRMRRLSRARFGAYLRLDKDTTVLSMSPELFLKVENGEVESHPIKGTRARGADETSDRLAQIDLLQSEKDAAELAMIVDVVRNDLSRVCEAGSVRVPEHASLLTLPSIYHTYSRVTGRLKQNRTVADLLKACFPPASISGAPKIAAVQAALREEGSGRGPCMGTIGWISMDGNLELSVAIRTAFTEGESIYYMAGCGVTCDSSPEAELVESDVKASAFIQALTGEDSR